MTSYSDTLQRGDTISCYQIEEVLGRGGFAVTYLAVDLNLDVHVAIKEYLPREIIHRDQQLNVSARRPELVEDYNIGLSNFAREAKTLARFKHLNIVRVHQVIHKYNTAYIVMDYEQGQELADVLADKETLSEDELRDMLFPVFDGVEEIHSHGLAHRDIKPSNIYLRENGSPVLLDFGAARYTLSESTQQLTAVVTVGYTPIEQYNVSENEQGPWTDIYALAAVLYEAVTGEMPVDSVTRASSRVTNSADPLSPVANKARADYSDHFLNAIDWGLSMEAEDRPQSIAQWRDAFNGEFKSAEKYEPQQKRPARKSKLKMRAKEPLAALVTEAQGDNNTRSYNDDAARDDYTVPMHVRAPESRHGVDVRDQRFDPNFDSHIDDVEIIPLDPDAIDRQSRQVETANAVTYGEATATLEAPPLRSSPFASNPAPRQTQDPRHPQNFEQENDAFSERLNNYIDAEGRPKHTQELRKVLRRDIVRREAPPPQAPEEALSRESLYPERTDSTAPQISTEAYREDAYREEPRRAAPIENDFEFDDSDWDYEPPPAPSRWRWLLPFTSLIVVGLLSVLYVNRPDLFKLPAWSGEEMTIETALNRASEKVQSRELIFPEGQSALDYYQLILTTDPNNAAAIGGIASIRDEIKMQIVEQVDSNNLPEANRLLARANAANLQIDGINNNSGLQTVTDNANSAVTETGTTPWVSESLDNVDALLAAGDVAGAENLFNDIDKYIADAELSGAIRQRIESAKTSTAGATDTVSSTETTDTVVTAIDTSPIVAEGESPALVAESAEIQPTNTGTDNTAEQTEITAVPTIAAAPEAPEPVAPEPIAAAPVVSETEQKIAIESEPETLPSAPRRSFIEGNDATAQHLNQLRLALEDKSLPRVLQVSGSLPEERTEFLRRLFQRYDRLDVTIDNINRSGNNATAKLSVAMFNQRSDGSYYSAGKWSDVELATSQQSGQWQPISW